MLKLLTAPVTNDHGPRYMERTLAAIHQANRYGEPVELIYASTDGRVGLFLSFADGADELFTGPIAANYPNCALTTAERFDDAPPGWKTWFADLELTPELFPILRHAQFEDLLNGTFADPVSSILRATKPDSDVRCRVEVCIRPAGQRRRWSARHAVRLLDREFFRVHHRLAEYYPEHITGPRGWLLAWLLGVLARQSPHQVRTSLDTSASRLHDREERLQAASDKIGGHLFETHIRLISHAHPDVSRLAVVPLRGIISVMSTSSHTLTEADILTEVVAPDQPTLPQDFARAALSVRFNDSATETIRELLQKNNTGTITTEEKADLEKYMRAGQFLDLMQAKARQSLKATRSA